MTTALTAAFGTERRALGASSTICRDASNPEKMKQVVSNEVRKQTPSGHPVELMKVAQTNSPDALGDDRMKARRVLTTNGRRVMMTSHGSISFLSIDETETIGRLGESRPTSNIMGSG